jgi:hypothetical protein
MSPVGEIAAGDRILTKATVTLQARYEHACALVARAAAGDQSYQRYTEALNELEMAMADHSIQTWAPTDPSMSELHDIDRVSVILSGDRAAPPPAAYGIVDRFKDLIGQPVPGGFGGLAVFAAHSGALARCGIHTAAQFSELPAASIATELGATAAEVAWLLDVAALYEVLRAAGSAPAPAGITGDGDKRAAAMTFLLLQARLDRLTEFRAALADQDGLKRKLLDTARPWAVAAPGEREIRGWQQALEARDHVARMRAGWVAVCLGMIPAPAAPPVDAAAGGDSMARTEGAG